MQEPGRPQKSKIDAPYMGNMLVGCSFRPNNASAPDLLNHRGVASVVRASTGVYTVTLKDAFIGVICARANLNKAAGAASYFANVTAYSVANKTFTITFVTEAGTATDVTGATADQCAFMAWLDTTDLEPAGG